jgi:hypothetical protein
MGRGIKRREIFRDERDGARFVESLGELVAAGRALDNPKRRDILRALFLESAA